MTHAEREIRREEMKAYKADGHTMQEVADCFGVTQGYAQIICKGIAPQKAKPQQYRNQYTNGKYDREANAIRIINERTPGFEYAGNFTGVDGYVDLKCKKCGAIIRKSFTTIRHGRNLICSSCVTIAQSERKKAEQQRKELRQKQRARERELKKTATQVQFKLCEGCGSLFLDTNKRKYCSNECLHKVSNALKKDRRIRKIRARVEDRDITLEKLYKRDRGICHLCGSKCDWDDYIINSNNVFIAGNNYPSIDHIKPLSMGGLHAWSNIKLACRICNAKRGNRNTSPCA